MYPRCSFYLYGDKSPEVDQVLAAPEFDVMVAPLLRSESATLPDKEAGSEGSSMGDIFRLAASSKLLTGTPVGYKAGRRLVAIPRQAEGGLGPLLDAPLRSYARLACEAVEPLREALEGTPVAHRHAWGDLCHTVVAGLLLDLAVGARLTELGIVQSKPSGDTVVWAFAQMSAKNSFGVQQWTVEDKKVMFAQLWHRRTPKRNTQLSPSMVERLLDLAGRDSDVDSCGPDAATRRLDLYLRHLGLLRRQGDGSTLTFPCFGRLETARLLPLLTSFGRALVDECIVPALDSLKLHPWWIRHMENDAYVHAGVRLLLEYGTDRALSAGALPEFPSKPEFEASWGRWLWHEPQESRETIVPDLAQRASGHREPVKQEREPLDAVKQRS